MVTTTTIVVALFSAALAVAAWEAIRIVRRRTTTSAVKDEPKLDQREPSLVQNDVSAPEASKHAAPTQSVRLYAGDVEIASMEAFAQPAPGSTLVPAPPAVRAHISALIQHGVGIGSTARTLFTSAVKMRFSPEVTRGLADGSFSVMKSAQGGIRGIAIDSAGKTVGQASLDVIGKGAAAATAIWQVAAMVTAQKFLADIDAKLASIEQGISDVKKWLENEQQAELVGQAQKIKSYVITLAEPVTPEHAQAILTNLEAMDGQARKRMAADSAQMRQLLEQLTPERLKGDLNLDRDALIKTAGAYESAHQRFLLGGAVRLAATQVRSALPSTLRATMQLASEAASDLEMHLNVDELTSRAELVTQELKKGFFQLPKTGEKARAMTRETYVEMTQRLVARSAAMRELSVGVVQRLSTQLETGESMLELVAKIEGGVVTEVHEVRSASLQSSEAERPTDLSKATTDAHKLNGP